MLSGTLARPDATLHFDTLGEGPDTLLLHAGGERRAVWRPVMEEMARRGWRTTAYDQRGHGESTRWDSWMLPAFGDDTTAMIAGLTRPVVVGASLGGFAALFALADPTVEAQVAGLVLVDVIPDPDMERTLRFLRPLGGDVSPRVADIMGRRERLKEITRGLSLPILLIRADREDGITDADVESFQALAPQARVATIPGAGHLIARDKPLALAGMLSDFQESEVVRDRREGAGET